MAAARQYITTALGVLVNEALEEHHKEVLVRYTRWLKRWRSTLRLCSCGTHGGLRREVRQVDPGGDDSGISFTSGIDAVLRRIDALRVEVITVSNGYSYIDF